MSSSKRFDIGHKYGLFIAQLAIALRGPDRDSVLARMFEVAATREGDWRGPEGAA